MAKKVEVPGKAEATIKVVNLAYPIVTLEIDFEFIADCDRGGLWGLIHGRRFPFFEKKTVNVEVASSVTLQTPEIKTEVKL